MTAEIKRGGEVHRTGRFLKGVLVLSSCAAGAFLVGHYYEGQYGDAASPARVLAVVPDADMGTGVDKSVDVAVEGAIARLHSIPVLERAAKALKLSELPEFDKGHSVKKLSHALAISREGDAPVISISAKLDDAAVSVSISNYLAGQITDNAVPEAPKQAGDSPSIYEKASAELTAFQSGEGAAIAGLNSDIANAKTRLSQLIDKEAAAKKLTALSVKTKIRDVLRGHFPENLMTSQLRDRLSQYAAKKANYEALSQKLGPLHPQLLAAKNAMDDAHAAIAAAIRAISMSSAKNTNVLESDVAAAKKTISALKKKLEGLQSKEKHLQAQLAAIGKNEVISQEPVTQVTATTPRFHLAAPATIRPLDTMMMALWSICGALAGLIAAAAPFILWDRLQELEQRKAQSSVDAVRKPPLQESGILEQIGMLEEMWPQTTGRRDELPTAVNDEQAQRALKPAYQAVSQMRVLRQKALAAEASHSEASLEEVLEDMQRLKAKVQWYAVEQERRRRLRA